MIYNKENPLRVFEAFAGYSSQGLALKRLKEKYPPFDFKRVGWAEFDPESNLPIDKQPAVIANKALFPDGSVNYGDITKIDWESVPDFDLFTYSVCCQDISQSGKQRGLAKGSGTRSSLLWDCEKAISTKKPKYLMFENVKALLSKKFINDWIGWVKILDDYGYETFTQVLNASDYNVPQNRERVFAISILRDGENHIPRYFFPPKLPLERRLVDVLEKDVDDKYFLSDEMLARFCEKSIEEDNMITKTDNEADTDDDGDVDFENLFVSQ